MKKLFTILLAITSAASAALAQDGAPGEQKPKKPKKDPTVIFQGLDKNKDGKVSKEEFMANKKGEWAAQGEKNFAGKDKDSDGYLTIEEFTAKKP
jgi:Ca2+-binding EF-hand superfamily protein